MTGYTLTEAEVKELTGAARAKRQMEFLAGLGIPSVLGNDGKVKVLRAAVDARMMPNAKVRTKTKTEPNLGALRRAS